jgi:23S rRNA pseudouridine2604 synthase
MRVDIMDIRLNKYLSDAGVCSRREADRLIEAGKVHVNGIVATMGQKVDETCEIMVNGKKIKAQEELILIALNKPVGIECTTNRMVKDNIIDYIGYDKRIFPIGRLDKNSEGLILLTNKGELSDKMMRGSNYHDKEYVVTVNKEITEEFIKKMSNGIHLVDKEHNIDVITRKCEVKHIGKRTFSIILTQGINRQIRRMCKECGYEVTKLKRIRIMNIKLDNLSYGKYRVLNESEIFKLNELLNK